MEEKITFGKFITKKRKELGITQKELAESLYVTESAVSKWERGVSYPDITLVSALCEQLHITERELITSSEDYRQREIERQAKTMRNIKKVYLWIFYASYGVPLVTCFIVNLAVSHKLNWFFIVLTSLLTAFSLTCVPVIAKKHKGLITLGTFWISLNVLLLTCCIYTGGKWFFVAFTSIAFGLSLIFVPLLLSAAPLPKPFSNHKTLISFVIYTLLLALMEYSIFSFTNYGGSIKKLLLINLASVSVAWVVMLIIRYLPCNKFYGIGISVILCGMYTFILNNLINSIIYDNVSFTIAKVNFGDWSEPYINGNCTAIVSLSMIAVGIMFIGGGVARSVLKRK